ncbi:glycosyltransferase [Flavobacterium sp.]|uniref:glycosyltransferase n=2 Tax=Flavobacterium sp. TaxID=239 RepID=UPI00404810BF
MKRIVVIGPNVGMGGVERASTNISNSLTELGHDVTYLALIPKHPFFKLKSKYVEPIDFNSKSMDFIKTLKYIRQQIHIIKPDAILCYTKFYAAISNLALLFTEYQVYVTERSSPLYIWPKKVEMFCKLSFKLKKVKGVISQTTIASQYHKEYYGKTKYTVIPNSVRDIKIYQNVKREKFILAVGRFNDDCKGFDLLVKAFNLVKDNEWCLFFAGGTQEDGQYLLDLALDHKKSKIVFLGAVKDMDYLYARAGIFVMPSRSEGFPNALAEALVAGCCCVSFDFIAGPRDLISNGVNGLLVEPENISELSRTIDLLIDDSEIRSYYSLNAQNARIKLDSSHIANRMVEFLIN